MTLRNEKAISELQNKPLIETQKHITINSLDFHEGEMVAHLSDSRSIAVPTA